MLTPRLCIFECDQAETLYSASTSTFNKTYLCRCYIRIPFPAFVTSTYNKLVPEIHVCDAVAADSVGKASADLIYKPRSAK